MIYENPIALFLRSGVRYLIFIFVFTLPAGSSLLLGRDDSVRLMSWNVRNYNLTDRYAHGYYRRDYPKPEKAKTAVRKVIAEQQPDLLLFQEIGGDSFLHELQRDLRQDCGVDYGHSMTLEAQDDARKLGVLSKFPFEIISNPVNQSDFFPYFDDRIRVKRGLLEIQIQLADGRECYVYTFHLKSRYTSNNRDPGSSIRREKEARIIRDYLRKRIEEDPDRFMVMMGDLNDGVASQAYARLTTVSGEPLMVEYPVKDRHGACWTYHYERHRSYEQIDFLFLSPALVADEEISLKARIVEGQSVSAASDHRPILVDFNF